MRNRALSQGFALPTVIITTVIMFAVLVAAVSVVSSTRTSLDTQFYEGLAADAAESGGTYAETCLKTNNFVSVWGANVLRPDTTCTGASAASTCTVAACWLASTSQYRTTYRVDPSVDAGNGVQTVKITGIVQLLRAGTGSVWQTYAKTTNIRVGAQITAQQVTFGYIGGFGSYFGVVGRDGVMRTVGYNGYGMLGNGTQTNTLTPTKFNAPTPYPIVAAYSNFLSVGYELFAIDSQGDVYGAGANDLGQLGNGTFTHPITTPTKVLLPGGVKAVYLSSLGWTSNYVIGDDNNVYAFGACAYGLLGNSYTISGCSNRNSYVRVSLPTPNVSDPNTLPVASSSTIGNADNIVSDRYNVAMRMQGGRVYIWGINDVGVLGTGNNTNSSTPLQLGTYGNAGQPKATQLAFDGETLYVLDNTGVVNAVGNGTYASLSGAPAQIQNRTSGKCVNNQYNLPTPAQVRLYDCIDASSQRMTFNPYTANPSGSYLYGTITMNTDASTTLCLDNTNSQTADNNPVQWFSCNGTSAQLWQYRDDGSILNLGSNKCLNNAGSNMANDAPLGIWTCTNHTDQQWNLLQSKRLTKVPIPSSAGKVVQVATDQWSVLYRTETGEVWAAGGNDRGQLCNGTTGKANNPKLTKVTLPVGRQATYIATTKVGASGSGYANSYIILDDGSVYGCGANTYGQLGNGSTATSVGTPTKMNLPAGVMATSIQTGYGTTVILTAAGTVYTVGNNGNGQLGDGTTTSNSTPVLAKYINDQAAVGY
ncbi:MAG: ricin-type beta-trefoil lectin domain protein [Candidatus Saccharimonas sp.]